ncbi:MAG TPA: hypothetical protein ENI65_12350 [Gammaproteobacteria bacterium]|nr:hypothetical protein [Gammaproteobacteria bacterium]
MSEAIPEYIDLIQAARKGCEFQGIINVDRLQRLSHYLAGNEGGFDVKVSFGMDDDNTPYMKGSASGQIRIPCQRCMEPILRDHEVLFKLVLVASGHQTEGIPDDIDTIIVTGEPAALINIIEDELILGLSIVEMHKPEECNASGFLLDKRAVPDSEADRKPGPFEVLKDFNIDS